MDVKLTKKILALMMAAECLVLCASCGKKNEKPVEIPTTSISSSADVAKSNDIEDKIHSSYTNDVEISDEISLSDMVYIVSMDEDTNINRDIDSYNYYADTLGFDSFEEIVSKFEKSINSNDVQSANKYLFDMSRVIIPACAFDSCRYIASRELAKGNDGEEYNENEYIARKVLTWYSDSDIKGWSHMGADETNTNERLGKYDIEFETDGFLHLARYFGQDVSDFTTGYWGHKSTVGGNIMEDAIINMQRASGNEAFGGFFDIESCQKAYRKLKKLMLCSAKDSKSIYRLNFTYDSYMIEKYNDYMEKVEDYGSDYSVRTPYVVEEGDDLTAIANKYDLTTDSVKQSNYGRFYVKYGVRGDSTIYPGETLMLPVGSVINDKGETTIISDLDSEPVLNKKLN